MQYITKLFCLCVLTLTLAGASNDAYAVSKERIQERCSKRAERYAKNATPKDAFQPFINQKSKQIGERAAKALAFQKRMKARENFYKFKYNECMADHED